MEEPLVDNPNNNNGKYKDRYIDEKFNDLGEDIKDIKKSIKTLNDHSGETVVRLTQIEGKIDPIQKIVYSLVSLILGGVVLATLTLILR